MPRSMIILLSAAAVVAVVGAILVATDAQSPTTVSREGTRIEAPGTTVESNEGGTRVQAPGVDITVPKDKDGD
jgi:hypothetical protein